MDKVQIPEMFQFMQWLQCVIQLFSTMNQMVILFLHYHIIIMWDLNIIKFPSLIFPDIQLNLIDTKSSGYHHGTYIPVSNALLKMNFFKSPPTSRSTRSLLKHNLQQQTTVAPDDNNTIATTTTAATSSIRQKRDLFESTTILPSPFQSEIIETSETVSVPLNVSFENYETSDNESMSKQHQQIDATENSTSNNLYPSFHVTYWMFYPYSQVSIGFSKLEFCIGALVL